jgi:hypothetical protein
MAFWILTPPAQWIMDGSVVGGLDLRGIENSRKIGRELGIGRMELLRQYEGQPQVATDKPLTQVRAVDVRSLERPGTLLMRL